MSDSAAADTTAAPEAPASEAPVQQSIEDPEIDLGDGLKFKKSELKDRVTKKAQWEQMSHQRYQQAAEMKKAVEKAIAGDPEDYFRLKGIDPDEWSKSRLENKLKYLEMSPEQRALMEAKQELEKVKQDKAKFEEDQKKTVYQQQVQKFEQYFDKQFAESMTQVSLPRTARTVKRMAEKVEACLANEMPVDMLDIAREVKQDYIEEYGSTLSEWDDETLSLILRDKAKDRARKLLLKDVKSPEEKVQSNKKPFVPSYGRPKKVIGLADLNKQYDKRR